MKYALYTAPVLIVPDMHSEFVMEIDASDDCIGGIVQKDQD